MTHVTNTAELTALVKATLAEAPIRYREYITHGSAHAVNTVLLVSSVLMQAKTLKREASNNFDDALLQLDEHLQRDRRGRELARFYVDLDRTTPNNLRRCIDSDTWLSRSQRIDTVLSKEH